MKSDEEQSQEFQEIFAKLKAMLNLTDEVMIRLYSTFFDTVSSTLQMLKKAIEAQDYDAIQLHAHSIKGSASSLCFGTISELAMCIEEKAKLNDNSENQTLCNELAGYLDVAHKNYMLWASKRG